MPSPVAATHQQRVAVACDAAGCHRTAAYVTQDVAGRLCIEIWSRHAGDLHRTLVRVSPIEAARPARDD